MQWTHPECQGTLPPPCRAHTATLVDNRRLVIFGGGEGPVYYNAVYVLDLPARRWTAPQPVPGANIPPPRRAHTAVHYKNRIWVFGGGNGMTALNDVWALDINAQGEAVWEELKTSRRRPSPRGYHTANLIGNVMVVVGGSDGRDCFSDVWALDLGQYLCYIPQLSECSSSFPFIITPPSDPGMRFHMAIYGTLTRICAYRHGYVDTDQARRTASPSVACLNTGRELSLHNGWTRWDRIPQRFIAL